MIEIDFEEALDVPVYGFQLVYGDTPKSEVTASIYEIRGIHQNAEIEWTGTEWASQQSAMADKIESITDYRTYFEVLFSEPESADVQVTVASATGINRIYAIV